MRVLYISAAFAMVWLMSRQPLFGFWGVAVIMAVAAFFVSRRAGWLALFVVPLSLVVLLWGLEDSFGMQGISALLGDRTLSLHFLAAQFVVWGASLLGAMIWRKGDARTRSAD